MIFLFVSLLKSTVQWKEIEADELKAEKEIVAWLDKLGCQDLSKAAVVNVAQAIDTRAVMNPRKVELTKKARTKTVRALLLLSQRCQEN